jgi:hypothetical protein
MFCTDNEDTKKCMHCGNPTSFERKDPLKEPPEGEICSQCDDWVCEGCIDWHHMKKVNSEDNICKECSK